MDNHQESLRNEGRRAGITAILLLGNYSIGLAASICFKQGGTDSAHRMLYFILGNVLGITSTALLMGIYARMNVNLAMVIVSSGGFLLQQTTFWLAYHTQLTAMQIAGILMVGVGTIMASLNFKAPEAAIPREAPEGRLQPQEGLR